MDVESIVLNRLIEDESFTRKTIPFLREEYFQTQEAKVLFRILGSHFKRYHKCAKREVLTVEVEKIKSLSESLYGNIQELIGKVSEFPVTASEEWLLDQAEEFCKDRALFNSMSKAIEIMDGSNKALSKTAIPELMREALAVSFDPKLGHDYFDNAEDQWEYYNNQDTKIPFKQDILNLITNGGIGRKTLNLILAATHGGKSLILGDFAANYLKLGLNVLYITLEMSEEEIRKRIDANLLETKMDDVAQIDKTTYLNKVGRIRKGTLGELKVKEYGTGSAGVAHFRAYVNELKLVHEFVPDIICVDYLNICCSERFAKADNSYAYNKAIAEEIRGFAKETNTGIWSATQLNREGAKDSDPDMTDISDSFGVAFTADFAVVTFRNEDLIRQGMFMVKQEKNRYRDLNWKKRFMMGMDTSRMRIFDAEESAQNVAHIDNTQDNTSTTPSSKASMFN